MQERRAATGNCGLIGILKAKLQAERVELSPLLQAHSALCSLISMAGLCTDTPGEAVTSWGGVGGVGPNVWLWPLLPPSLSSRVTSRLLS